MISCYRCPRAQATTFRPCGGAATATSWRLARPTPRCRSGTPAGRPFAAGHIVPPVVHPFTLLHTGTLFSAILRCNAIPLPLLYGARRKQVRELCGHTNRVSCVSWNGSILSSGSRDSTIANWDVRKRRDEACIATLNVHEQVWRQGIVGVRAPGQGQEDWASRRSAVALFQCMGGRQ